MLNFIGQEQLREVIDTNIQASKISSLAFPHTLFKGPPGYGKTSIANLIAKELDYPFLSLLGNTIDEDTCELLFVDLKPNTVVFIDEIHAIPKVLTEFLYPIMEDYTIRIGVQSFKLNDFTLIGATTNPEWLTKALRDRFKLDLMFTNYTNKELMHIGELYADTLKVKLDKSSLLYLARVCHGTPRVLKNYISSLHRYDIVHKCGRIDLATTKKVLHQLGIDENGLRALDIVYLKTLKYTYAQIPVSANTLTKILNVNKLYLETDIENFLLTQGYITITNRGRVLTSKGHTVV